MEKKNTKGTTALVVLLLIVTIAALILATYAWAKYTSEVGNGTATANVAKWNITANVNGTAQWTQEYKHVVKTRVAPGTSGIIPITVNLNDTEVCANFDVFITSVTNKPTNLKFYSATEGSTAGNYVRGSEINLGTITNNSATGLNVLATSGTLNLDGTNHNAAANASNGKAYIWWEWAYETGTGTDNIAANDAIDTNEASLGEMSVGIKIVATQVNPTNATH